jgi:hypothetical protein
MIDPKLKLEELLDSVIYPVHLAKKYNFGAFAKILMWFYGNKPLDKNSFRTLAKHGLGKRIRLPEAEVVKILKAKNATSLEYKGNIPFKFCEWCCSETFVLHSHHYPVRRKDKGDKTVKICANCHSEFHYLTDHWIFEINSDILEELTRCKKERDARILELQQIPT